MMIANMLPERWRLIEELFHAAFELPPNERSGFLLCHGVHRGSDDKRLLRH